MENFVDPTFNNPVLCPGCGGQCVGTTLANKLREQGDAHWFPMYAYPGGGSNSSGFSALPDAGNHYSGMWQSSSQHDGQPIYSWQHYSNYSDYGGCRGVSLKGNAYAVRCIKD